MIDDKTTVVPSYDIGRSRLRVAGGAEVPICDLCGEDAVMTGGDPDVALCAAHLALHHPDLATLHATITAAKRAVRRRR